VAELYLRLFHARNKFVDCSSVQTIYRYIAFVMIYMWVRSFRDVGIAAPELKELSPAVEAGGNQKLEENGPVVKWIKATASKVLAGGVKMGAEVGEAVLTEMLMQYYGLK
jgi:hypothetical protein